MFNHHSPNCHAPAQGTALVPQSRRRLSISILRTLTISAVVLLASGLESNVEARVPALQVELPSVQGWQIEAIKRGNSVMCSARPREESAQGITLLADMRTYRGGVWFLEVVSRNHHLKSGVEETVARLFLNGKHVVTGKALDVGDWVGNKRTATYVRFEFPAIDAHVKDIKAAQTIEVQAEGLSPLKLESLSPIITAIEKCQQESLNPEFWKDAKYICN